ncbi:MAG: bifunctional shikimate kinase/3-dehydroquinate synthase [Candidatus Eremiobacteraeota bacterium]|nr:bifunctional shikimate kinase/3-dehydroquinate synthase [Candidatus Eremiobacteraeota bacterium]
MDANVYLCGPPGAGKSSVAPRLAALREAECVDVDATIEKREGCSIAQLIDQRGEAAFRALEREAIASLTERHGLVVALGGGALQDPVNRDALRRSGAVVFLDASLATCERRTASANGARPLLREPGALARLHGARRPTYETVADLRVRVDELDEDAAAAMVDARLRDEQRIIRVATAKPYDVAIGEGALIALPRRVAPAAGGRVVIVADTVVAATARRIAGLYEHAGFTTNLLPVTADEALKSLDAIGALYERFLGAGLDRRGIVVGVGGGTIGDAVGFAAATFQRGIPFVGIPTTLLSAVDAAIGGKTGINLAAGKNLVGTVTQPAHVAIAPSTLRSLPARDVVSGYGEMLKYGLALDATLYGTLREGERLLLADPATPRGAIARCVELKAEIVARDEEDRLGARAVLNFGHTIGHALERVAGYGTLRHGEAVIVGMRAALALSVVRGLLQAGEARQPDEHLASLPVPDDWRKVSADEVLAAAAGDKKRGARGTRYVLLEAIGRARLDDGVGERDVRSALAQLGLR